METEQVEDWMGENGPAHQAVDQMKEKLQSVDKFLRTAARERPLMTLGVALGIGYLLGRLIGTLTMRNIPQPYRDITLAAVAGLLLGGGLRNRHVRWNLLRLLIGF